jgi:hypothetical protein
MGIIRILLIADTHLGADLPFRPRIKRRNGDRTFLLILTFETFSILLSQKV